MLSAVPALILKYALRFALTLDKILKSFEQLLLILELEAENRVLLVVSLGLLNPEYEVVGVDSKCAFFYYVKRRGS